METTFMTIHNLTPAANILYASASITDVLGWEPHQVHGRSCFEYFHADEVPLARFIHHRGVELDKAAVLHYARILASDGQYVGCECVFTIVYDVLVACTSIYRQGMNSERRAIEAPTIRRLFASSPRDPRYHMLEHLSTKFQSSPDSVREPRAALILNRFTRTLTVMYATSSIETVLGISPDEIKDKSFYEYITEECLDGALRSLESAKANDSIAYLRFFYQDPRGVLDSDSSDSEDGGVELSAPMDVDTDTPPTSEEQSDSSRSRIVASSRVSPDEPQFTMPAAYRRSPRALVPRLEVEAVVSCTSDGLVVIIRRARPMIPFMTLPAVSSGVFAAPWGVETIPPPPYRSPSPAVVSQQARHIPGGPPVETLMNTIREVAVFAWSLTGINGRIASYATGRPRGEAVPPNGFPVWDRQTQDTFAAPVNQAQLRWSQIDTTRWMHPRALPGLDSRAAQSGSGNELHE